MCSSCGQRAAKLPGAKPRNAIVLGEANDATPQPATFLVNHANAMAGHTKYVTGSGVEDAVADGTIRIGYVRPTQVSRSAKLASNAPDAPRWYVKTGSNKWVGFKVKAAADRYARTKDTIVLTRDEVLGKTTGGAS
jgi:hypothetical protein